MAFVSTEEGQKAARAPEREDETTILARLDRMVREAVQHPVNWEWRPYATKAFLYEEGHQLDADMLQALRERGQPAVVENRIRPQRKRFMGTYHRLRLKAAFTGRNAPMDEAEAGTLNDVNRFVDQNCGFVDQEALVARDAFIAGVGWLERGMEREANGKPYLYSRYVDPFEVWPDPYGRRADLADHRYVIRGKWMDLDEAIAQWPHQEPQLMACMAAGGHQSVTGSMFQEDPPWVERNEQLYFDSKRKRIRPFEVWYRRKVIRKVAITPDGTRIVLDAIGPRQAKDAIQRAGYQEGEAIVERLYLGLFCGLTLIHHDLSPYEHGEFPYVQYLWDRQKDGRPVGWVSDDIMSMQDALNKRQSKALHLLNSKQVVYTENSVEDDEELAEELAKPDGKIKLKQGRKIDDQFQVLPNTEMGQSQLQLYALNRQAFDDVGSTSDVGEGRAPGEVRSDRGLQRLEANATALDSEPLNHIKSARRQGLLLQTANIQQYFTEDMVVQVTDDPSTARVFQISQAQFAKLRQYHVNLVLVEENDYATTRQQQLDLLANSLPQLLQYGAGWAGLLISLTDLREKEKLLEMVQAMSQPPQPEPKLSLSISWADLPLNERIMWAVKIGFPEELLQVMQQGAMPSKTELTIQNDQAKQQSKERMEQGRLSLKAMELDLRQDEIDKNIRLDALTASAQEETKRAVAERQAASTRKD